MKDRAPTDKKGVEKSFTVRDLPVTERPRERLQKYGAEKLSAQELLSVILGRGIAGESVMKTAQRLLREFGLQGLAYASVEELSQIRGIGQAKACQIKAAFQLSKCCDGSSGNGAKRAIKNPDDAANAVRGEIQDKHKEHFMALFLDTRSKLIKWAVISIGCLDSSIVHPREVFKEAISASAASVIFVHNHPSGDAEPSEDDIKLTKRLAEVGELMGIEVLDHVIIGEGDPFSLKRNGLF